MMNHVYKVGKRFDKMRNACVGINILVVFVFYFVYKYIFGTQYAWFVGTPMMVLFILFGAVVTKATLYFGDKLKANIRYEIGKECLIVGSGKTLRRYPWANFTAVRYDKFKLRDLMPVCFELGEEKLTLNQYVDDIYNLTHEILRHIGPKVPVDKEITDRLNVMR